MVIEPWTGNLVEPLTGRRWDAGEIRRRVEARTAVYRAAGLTRGGRVFVGFGNRLELFVELLAIWSRGGCVVPIDGRLTAFEVRTLAAAARPELFVHCADDGAELGSELAKDGVRSMDAADPAMAPRSVDPGGSPELDDDALILFTSGTTGNPKGVVHTHRSLRARWSTLALSLDLSEFRRTLCLLPTHFGHGLICNALFPWLHGAELFVLPPFSAEVVSRLGRLIDEHRITFLSSVPAVWRLALKIAAPPQRASLDRVFCGSAPLGAHLWNDVRRWAGVTAVSNAYGITETGSWVAGTPRDGFEPADGLVGRPWGATIAIMQDGSPQAPPGVGVPAEAGETGFVWLNTPALMRGYLGRDDLTAQVVRRGWFVTGDLGWIDGRGYLSLRGRVREEINKGGMKVHPADVDAVAERHPRVRDACCFAVVDPLYGQNVGLAVVLDDGDEAILRDVAGWLKRHLASHQMPVRWYRLEAIPRTSRGKINRQGVAASCAELDAVSGDDLGV